MYERDVRWTGTLVDRTAGGSPLHRPFGTEQEECAQFSRHHGIGWLGSRERDLRAKASDRGLADEIPATQWLSSPRARRRTGGWGCVRATPVWCPPGALSGGWQELRRRKPQSGVRWAHSRTGVSRTRPQSPSPSSNGWQGLSPVGWLGMRSQVLVGAELTRYLQTHGSSAQSAPATQFR